MPFQVNEYVHVFHNLEWKRGTIISQLPNGFFQVGVGGGGDNFVVTNDDLRAVAFRVGEYVTVRDNGPAWHGEIIAKLPNEIFRVRVGGTGGDSIITHDVAKVMLTGIFPTDKPVVRRVFVALFKVNTQNSQDTPMQARMDDLSAAVLMVKEYVDRHSPLAGNEHRIRCIFLAPEYMFANPIAKKDHTLGDQRQMEASENARLREFFVQISGNFPNALIIPGTVTWRKPIVVPDEKPSKHVSKGLTEAAYRQNYRRDKAMGKMTNAPNTHFVNEYKTDEPMASRVSPLDAAGNRPLYTYMDKYMQLLDATYIAKNTAYCYYNGTCIFKYNKIGDFHEVLDPSMNTVHIPGVLAGRFTCGGMQFGISICFDQSLYQNTQSGPISTLPLQKTRDPVDFHILMSAHIRPDFALANIVPGGYLLSCSSADSCNDVLGEPLVKAEETLDCNSFKIDIYRV